MGGIVLAALETGAVQVRFETMVSEENGLLSTGQRRRLMLARALYKQPALLLADELLSNLDAETGARIIENLRRLDTAVVVSAHSREVIPGCSSYLVIRQGPIAFIGPEGAELAA